MKYYFLLMFVAAGCNSTEAKKEPTLKEYDLASPDKFNMPESLHEISGITFRTGNSDTIYAVQDEEGKVFRLAWDIKKQYHSKFGKKGDYEDLAIIGEQVFILKSNGTLYSFPFADMAYEEIDSTKEWKNLVPDGEYEGMYGDESSGKLYIICKNCTADKKSDQVSGYIIQTGDSLYQSETFAIDVAEIKSFTGKVKRGFRPSAIAKSPSTGDWYILASVNKLLIVTDVNWKIKEVSALNGNMYNQPEGICFDSRGNLYISNEGDDLSEANILKFGRIAKPD